MSFLHVMPYIVIDRHLSLTRTHWGVISTLTHWFPLDPCGGINVLWRWTSILEININTNIAKVPRTTRHTDGRTCYTATMGIWTLGLWPHAIRATMGHTLWLPKSDADKRIERQRHGHMISTGPQWGPSYPSVGINALQHWTPKLEINTNTKIPKFLRTNGRKDGWEYYTATQGIWPWGLQPHVLHVIPAVGMIVKKGCEQPDKETERQT